MEHIYEIPLVYEGGEFSLDQIPPSEDHITISVSDSGLLLCSFENGRQVTLYCVDPAEFEETMNIKYREDGSLHYVEYTKDDSKKLAYINFRTEKEARVTIREYAVKDGERLAKELREWDQTLGRLFSLSYYDGELFEYSILPCSEKDVRNIRKYGLDDINYSGNYSSQDRIMSDIHNFGVMLQCVPLDSECNYFYTACCTMAEQIVEYALPKMKISDDFRFIDEEFDDD